MKLLMIKHRFVFLLSILLVISLGSAQDLPEIEILTWSEDIAPGDTYQWNVNKFAFNGTPVTDIEEYGIIEGSVITLTVDVQLSDVNIAPYLNDNLELPEVGDYVTIDVDGTERNITIFHPGIFILPTNLTLANGGGNFNALFAAYFNDAVFFSAENSFNQFTSEYREFNDSVIEEVFVWEIYLGVLKSITIHWDQDLELNVTVVNPEQFNTFPSSTSPSSGGSNESPTRKGDDNGLPINMIIPMSLLLVIPILRKKLK